MVGAHPPARNFSLATYSKVHPALHAAVCFVLAAFPSQKCSCVPMLIASAASSPDRYARCVLCGRGRGAQASRLSVHACPLSCMYFDAPLSSICPALSCPLFSFLPSPFRIHSSKSSNLASKAWRIHRAASKATPVCPPVLPALSYRSRPTLHIVLATSPLRSTASQPEEAVTRRVSVAMRSRPQRRRRRRRVPVRQFQRRQQGHLRQAQSMNLVEAMLAWAGMDWIL